VTRVENPLGLGLVLVGAAAMALSTFLPLDEPGGFQMVTHNTLIQHDGWMLIAVAIGIAAGGFRASQKPRQWVRSAVLCVLAGGGVTFWFLNKSMRTLYPIGLDGTLDTSQPGTVAALGIALYVAGAGVAIAFVGSLMLRSSGTDGLPTQPQKKWTLRAVRPIDLAIVIAVAVGIVLFVAWLPLQLGALLVACLILLFGSAATMVVLAATDSEV
jgi:hypothetical protein